MGSHAEKNAARVYAAEHGVSYQSAINTLREGRAPSTLRPGQAPLPVGSSLKRGRDGCWWYGEHVEEHWLSRYGEPSSWTITLPLIEAVPGLEASIIERLRYEVSRLHEEVSSDPRVREVPPHPDDLTDRELLQRWLSADPMDEVYGDPDLLEPWGDPDQFAIPMSNEFANPFDAAVLAMFPGLSSWGGIVLETAAPVPDGATGRHRLLVEQVPDWGRFLSLVGPWSLQ